LVLKQCAVLIVVVGPYWTGARTGGSPRILDQADPVRTLDQIIGATSAAAKGPNAPALDGVAGSQTAPDGENWRGARALLIYLTLSVLVMVLAHYLVVLKWGLHFYFLQLFDILLPAAAGFLLFWNERRGWIWATLWGAGMAMLTVAGMQIVMALVAGTTLIPSTMVDWEEAVEFLASIQLATIAGNMFGRAASSSKLHTVARDRTAGGR
jgi:cation transport ATPase